MVATTAAMSTAITIIDADMADKVAARSTETLRVNSVDKDTAPKAEAVTVKAIPNTVASLATMSAEMS